MPLALRPSVCHLLKQSLNPRPIIPKRSLGDPAPSKDQQSQPGRRPALGPDFQLHRSPDACGQVGRGSWMGRQDSLLLCLHKHHRHRHLLLPDARGAFRGQLALTVVQKQVLRRAGRAVPASRSSEKIQIHQDGCPAGARAAFCLNSFVNVGTDRTSRIASLSWDLVEKRPFVKVCVEGWDAESNRRATLT